MNKAMTDKIYTRAELRTIGMDTSAYRFLQEVGDFYAELQFKAEARNGMLRAFFLFEDGRHIITPLFWWQRPHGLWALPVRVRLLLHYEHSPQGGVFLAQAAEA